MNFEKQTNTGTCKVEFRYSESCKNVYKKFSVYVNERKSNVKGLLRFVTNDPPDILTAKTYFWTPARAANMRRRAEEKREAEVLAYMAGECFTQITPA